MKTMLVLDDELIAIGLLRRVLKEYALIEATTAEQAIRRFNARGRQIDLLLARVKLQRSSGIQLALLLRWELPNLPVILTSECPVTDWSDRDFDDLERLGLRSVAILKRPFQPQLLLYAVYDLIGSTPTEMVRTA
jgi:CheY-like chemotaxis protein